jgi:hypothetical protein
MSRYCAVPPCEIQFKIFGAWASFIVIDPGPLCATSLTARARRSQRLVVGGECTSAEMYNIIEACSPALPRNVRTRIAAQVDDVRRSVVRLRDHMGHIFEPQSAKMSCVRCESVHRKRLDLVERHRSGSDDDVRVPSFPCGSEIATAGLRGWYGNASPVRP